MDHITIIVLVCRAPKNQIGDLGAWRRELRTESQVGRSDQPTDRPEDPRGLGARTHTPARSKVKTDTMAGLASRSDVEFDHS